MGRRAAGRMLLAGALLALAGGAEAEAQAQVAAPAVKKDVPYVPTPPEVVQVMLEMAGVKAGDVVYDLGCGDGRIVIAAVKIRGVRGVCVDIDPERIHESRQNAQIAQVVSASNYLRDVNVSGTLTVSDKGIANTQITKALPAP